MHNDSRNIAITYQVWFEPTHKCLNIHFSCFIKPGAHGRRPRVPGFLKLFRPRTSVCLCVCVCVCVCPPPRPLIPSGVIWCDIDRVRLVKQVLWLFPAFNYFITAIVIDKMDGRSHFNTARSERLLKKTKVTQY